MLAQITITGSKKVGKRPNCGTEGKGISGKTNHRAKAKNYEKPWSLQETNSLTQLSLRKQVEKSTRCKSRKIGKTLCSKLSYLGITGATKILACIS